MNPTSTQEITPQTTMGEILSAYPSAKRTLFQKYHIGGCSSCGYSLDQTLEEVMINHRRGKEVQNAIQFIYQSAEIDKMAQITPQELKNMMDKGEKFHLIDVREDWEIKIAKLPNSQILTQRLAYEILNKWNKNEKIIFYCHHGIRSLEAAAYFIGHGIPNAKSLAGGIERYSMEIDPSIPRY